jgi:hypothetical protein
MADAPDALIRSFAGQPVLNDPRVGRVEGARGLRDFVSEMASWLRERDVALTRTPRPARSRRSRCTCSQTTGDASNCPSPS